MAQQTIFTELGRSKEAEFGRRVYGVWSSSEDDEFGAKGDAGSVVEAENEHPLRGAVINRSSVWLEVSQNNSQGEQQRNNIGHTSSISGDHAIVNSATHQGGSDTGP